MLIQFAGLQLHLYGLILGIAGSVGILIGEKIVAQYDEYKAWYWRVVPLVFLGGVIGARLYHVWTDWPLYADHLDQIVMLQNGGLSIIGAILGGCLAIILTMVRKGGHLQKDSWFWMDLSVLCLPVAQAIGRLGNFVNQELYGQPTQLPWAIFIDRAHRVRGYEQFSNFHPLFAYEAIGLLIFAVVVLHLWRTNKWRLGDGKFLLSYLAFYGIFRGMLEFLRIEKASFMQTGLGLNQALLFVVGVVSAVAVLIRLRGRVSLESIKKAPLVLMIVAVFLTLGGCSQLPERAKTSVPAESPKQALKIDDHSFQRLKIVQQRTQETRVLNVEVVNSAKSIEQGLSDRESIGSDGMLFMFAQSARQTFWMPRMKFDLDMIWIDEGKIIGFTENAPRPSSELQNLSTLPKYQSPAAVDMVLEVPAGSSKAWQIQVGDALELL